MAWRSIDLLGAQVGTVDSSQVFNLGQTCKARNTSNGYIGEFVYMQGVASNADTLFCQLDYDTHVVSLLADGAVGGVGLSMGALVASTFGWFQIRGKGSGMLAASVADNAQLYINAGGVGQATASGKSEIIGARAAAASGSSAAATDVEIHYPTCSILNQAA